MANYDISVGDETTQYFIPFTINLPNGWLTDTGSTGYYWHHGTKFAYVYVRGFTGLTEMQCINNHIPAGGYWYTVGWATGETGTALAPYSSTTSALSVYCKESSRMDINQKVYGRIEVYWPGIWQKEIKYSRATTLCGHVQPNAYGSKDVRTQYRALPNVISVTFGGQHMQTRYVTYGGCYDTYRDINYKLTAMTPNYSESVYHDRLIMMNATGTSAGSTAHIKTGQTLYNVLQTSAGTILVTTSPSPNASDTMRYRPVANVGVWSGVTGGLGEVACDHDNYSSCSCYGNCDDCYSYCGDSDCTKEEEECDYEYDTDCTYDCNSHTCGMDYGEYCNCENTDDNEECKLDNMPSKNCVFNEIPCIYGTKNGNNGVGDAFIIDLPKQIPLSSIRVRLEGAIISVTRDNVFKFSSGTTSMEYFKFGVSGTTNGHVKGYVTTSSLPTNATYFKELSTVTPNVDFDITVGNGYIYDNNTSANIYTGTTYTDQRWLTRIYISLTTFRMKRVRVYDGEELVSDLVPGALLCPTTNDGNLDSYGDASFVAQDSVTNLFHSIVPSNGLYPCAPTCATVFEGPLDWVAGGDSNIIVPIQNNLTSSAITFRFEGAFLNFSQTGPFMGITGSTIADTTGNRHIITYFDNTSSGGYPGLYFNYNRKYSGSGYKNYLSGVTLNADVDLTFSLGKIVDNNNGGAMVYTASTTISNTYRKVTKYFVVDLWCLKVYRFRVYSNGNLAYDGTPYWKFQDGKILAGLYDSVSSGFAGNATVNYPDKNAFVMDFWSCGGNIGTTYLFKLMSNDSVYYQQYYHPGETIDMTAFTNPTLACHTFTGWSPLLPTTMPEADFTSVAQYTVNSHTIIYYLKDGEHGSSQYVQYASQTYNCGDTIVPPTVTPGNGWEFTGWSLSGHTTMPDQNLLSYGDVIVYVPSYRMRFYSGVTSWGNTSCGSLVKTEYYHAGDTISYPPTGMYCMNTTGWRTLCDGGPSAPSTMPGNDLDVYLNYHYNMFDVYWKAGIYDSGSYSTYRTDQAEYGDRIYYSNGPDLTNSAPSGYEWGGWPSGSESIGCSDTTIYSYFYPTAVTYYNINYYAGGELYTTVAYPEGATVTPIAVPTDPNGCKTYGNWQGVPSTMPATDVNVYSSSSATAYTAAFYINKWNGGTELYGTYSVEANEGLGVFLPQNDGYSYTPWQDGSSWYPYMPCSDASAYTTETKNQYIATFYTEDGTYYDTYVGYHLDPIVRPTPYTKPGCTVGWPSSPEVFNGRDVSIYAIEVCPTRTAYFYRADGTSMGTDTGLQGDTITYPSLYTKTGYDVAWPSNAPTTFGSGNVTITAVETIHSWTVYWLYENGTTYTSQRYNYGASISEPSCPNGCVWESHDATMPDSNYSIYMICSYSCSFTVQYDVIDGIAFSSGSVWFMVEGGGSVLLSDSFAISSDHGTEEYSISWPASWGTYVSASLSGGISLDGTYGDWHSNIAPNSVSLQDGSSNGMAIWASAN